MSRERQRASVAHPWATIRRRAVRVFLVGSQDLPDFKVDNWGDQDYPVELTVQGSRGGSGVILLLDGVR